MRNTTAAVAQRTRRAAYTKTGGAGQGACGGVCKRNWQTDQNACIGLCDEVAGKGCIAYAVNKWHCYLYGPGVGGSSDGCSESDLTCYKKNGRNILPPISVNVYVFGALAKASRTLAYSPGTRLCGSN